MAGVVVGAKTDKVTRQKKCKQIIMLQLQMSVTETIKPAKVIVTKR